MTVDRSSGAEHYRRLKDQVEGIHFLTEDLEGEVPGRSEARDFFGLIDARYLENWQGYSEAGPQILFMGSEKQGKSTILMGIMRILFADPSFEWLQKLRRAGIPAEYGKKLSYFKEDPSVYITTREGTESAHEHEACQTLLDEPLDDPSLIVELMPRDPLHRLLRAALLVEGAIATAWTAYFHFDQRYAGDNERAEVRFRTRQEMKEYIDRVSEPHKRKLLLSEEQRARDRELLAMFRLRELPDDEQVTRLNRGDLRQMKSRDCHAEVFKHIQLLKDHKHLVKEIRWFAAAAPGLSGLDGLTLVDSPGFKEEGDSNSEITMQALKSTLFFNIIVEAPRFQGDFLNKLFERVVAQPNIIDELLLGRFMLTLTMVERMLDSPDDFESEAATKTIRKMILGRCSELGQKLTASTAIAGKCDVHTDGMLPLSFITGAVHDQKLTRSKGWLEWSDPTNLEHFKDIEIWKNKQGPELPSVDMRRMAEELGAGNSARYIGQTLHQHGPWLRRTFNRQIGADFSAYVARIDRVLRSILPDPGKSLDNKWRDIVRTVHQETKKLSLRSSLELIEPDRAELAEHLDEAQQAVREHFGGLRLILRDVEPGDQVDYLGLYLALAARKPVTSRAAVARFLADRFHTNCVRNWLTTSERPDFDDVLTQVWSENHQLIIHHVHKSIHRTFRQILETDQRWREDGASDDELRLCELVAEGLGLVDLEAAQAWIEATYTRLDKLSLTPEEKNNRERGKEIKESVAELKRTLGALAAAADRTEGDKDDLENLSKEELLELLRRVKEPGDAT